MKVIKIENIKNYNNRRFEKRKKQKIQNRENSKFQQIKKKVISKKESRGISKNEIEKDGKR